MIAYELLYNLRLAAEQRIVECDAALGFGVVLHKRDRVRVLAAANRDENLIMRRRRFARLAWRFHAKIERLELRYG
jgi:hypothetical protein